MLEEVRSAVGFVSLGAASGIYPHANRRRLRPRRVLRGDLTGQLACIQPIGTFPTYCEAIAQSSALGLAAMANGSSKAASEAACVPSESVEGLATAQALLKVES